MKLEFDLPQDMWDAYDSILLAVLKHERKQVKRNLRLDKYIAKEDRAMDERLVKAYTVLIKYYGG